jgi:hypothetical protein
MSFIDIFRNILVGGDGAGNCDDWVDIQAPHMQDDIDPIDVSNHSDDTIQQHLVVALDM